MKKISLIIALVGVILIPSKVFSQYSEIEVKNMISQASEKELVIECSRMLQENFFYYADLIADKLLKINPNSANYKYRKGYIVLTMSQDYESAIQLLKGSTGSIDKNYDMYSLNEDAVPADIFYHLGHAYHFNEEFENAKKNYAKFLEVTNKNSEIIAYAQRGITQCNVASSLMAEPMDVTIENLGDSINTIYADFSSNISLDGRSLYYTSRRPWADGASNGFKDPLLNHFPEDIYQAGLSENNEWLSPTRVDFCKPNFNEASVSVSIDERRVYTYNDKKGRGDIYFSDLKNGAFSPIAPVSKTGVNTESRWETHYTVSPDGKMIFFVSDKESGYGKRDIYFIEDKNGVWTDPKNIGGTINSKWDEDAPFMGLDNNVLYFSSNDSTSMGEFDIFMTVKDENGIWSTPVNMGYPINSVGDDIFYTHTADGKQAYLTSFRKGGKGEKDIYRMNVNSTVQNIAFLNGEIIHAENKSIPEESFVELICLDCDDKNKIIIKPRIKDGVFLSKLEKCKEYQLSYFYNEETISPFTEKFSTNCDLAYQEIYKRVLLEEENEVIIPFFEYNLEGVVADRKSGELIPNAKVIFTRDGEEIEVLATDSTGLFISNLVERKDFGYLLNYTVTVSADGYLMATYELNETLGSDSLIQLSYLLDKKEIGTDLGPFMIYYNFDKFDIREDAKVELDKIVKVMNENPEVKIELGSHTDCRGSSNYNSRLSKKRAKSAGDYIAKRITNSERIVSRGYGESQPVSDCKCDSCSKEEHQLNRRTEFIIIP